MMRLELSDLEQRMVADALQTAVTTLDMEIERADSIDFKDMLKERRKVLGNVLDRLPPAPAPKPIHV